MTPTKDEIAALLHDRLAALKNGDFYAAAYFHEALIAHLPFLAAAYIAAPEPAPDAGALAARLLQYEGASWETNACYNGLRAEAAARITALSAQVAALEAALKETAAILQAALVAGKVRGGDSYRIGGVYLQNVSDALDAADAALALRDPASAGAV